MAFKFTVKTQDRKDGTENNSWTMIAISDKDAQEQAEEYVKFYRGTPQELIGIIKKTEKVKTFTLAEDLFQRTGIKPAYGDYEGTGWMDENHFGN